MFLPSFTGMAPATSIFLNILLFANILTCLIDPTLSQSVLKDLMTISPSDETEMFHLHRTTRNTVNLGDWFLSTKGCNPTCRGGILPEICAYPPTRQELCALSNNTDWCCQDWSHERPKTLHFKPNCDVVCVPYSPCPYSKCRRCEEIDNNHACCKDKSGCSNDYLLTARDGRKLWNSASTTALVSGRDATDISEPAETCPDVPDTVCQTFNGNPTECRLIKGCVYNCRAETCQNSGTINGEVCYDSCFNHCADKCGCTQRPGCLWEKGSRCRSATDKHCSLAHFPGKICARKGAYYSVGGALCKNIMQKGDCELDFTVVAANLGSDTAQLDRYGIEYRPEAEIKKEDPLSISQAIAFTPGDIKTDNERDKDIYATAVTANGTRCGDENVKCIDYLIPTMTWDGDYELALKLVEGVYTEKLKRRFTVQFAGVEIFSEFDILTYSGEQFRPVDVYANFKVSQKGKMITFKGHKTRRLNTTAKLSLCSGECGDDNSFIMSGFHIIKQKELPAEDPCVESPNLQCETTQFDSDECERAEGKSTYYSFGGKICQSLTAGNNGNCGAAQVHKAVNLNGLYIMDSRGIDYEQDLDENVDDEKKAKRGRESFNEAAGYANPEDRDLYNTLSYADTEKLQESAEVCMRYEIPLGRDGNYELAVRTADDESDGPGQRKFNVLLGDIAVFPEVDLFYLTGKKSQAVDLTLNFKVTDKGTNIRLKGYITDKDGVIKLSPENSVQLSFCTSKCDNVMCSRSWLIGSFSVISFIPVQSDSRQERNSTCANFDNDPCGCKYTTVCEYNVVTRLCTEREMWCNNLSERECRMGDDAGGQLYVVGGEFCPNSNSTVQHTDCNSKGVFGINFGPAAGEYVDPEGIRVMRDSGFKFEDPRNVKNVDNAKGSFATLGFREYEEEIYRKYMWGKVGSLGKDACITYYIPTRGDGHYELILRTGEYDYTFVKKRDNSYIFNGVVIAPSFEPRQYLKEDRAFSIRVPYRVFGNEKKMQMEGYPVAAIDSADKTMPISFCPGECNWPNVDHDYKVGALAVKKFVTNDCSGADGDSCACRSQTRCEYNVQNNQCGDRGIYLDPPPLGRSLAKTGSGKVCSLVKNTADECRRGGSHVFYAHGGQICPTGGASGNCSIEQVMIAINFGDGAGYHKDINGIEYVSSKTITFDDPDNTRQVFPRKSKYLNESIPQADVLLYQTIEWGNNRGLANPRCLGFAVPTAGDGEYEISIKTGEMYYKNYPPQRTFSFKLNGIYIVRNFEPGQYAPLPKAMDLNANFRVSDGGEKISLRGQASTVIGSIDKSVPFEICPGECAGLSSSWVISAISVVKLQKSVTSADFNGNPCECRIHGYQYNVVTSKCVETLKACSVHYVKDNECHRGGDTSFYVRAGIICPNSVTFGNCEIEKTLLGVNFFGNQHTDINGITYSSESGISYTDPNDIRKNGSDAGLFPVEGVPALDIELYTTSMFSNALKDSNNCVTYQIPTDGYGDYELGVKFAELWYQNAGTREFSYYFNEQVVVEGLDMAAVRDAPNKGFDLLVNYRVINDKLQMRGYPESTINTADKSIPLAFCAGTCTFPPWEDTNFAVAAFSVVKFKNVPTPKHLMLK